MIVDSIAHADRYAGLPAAFQTAFAFLSRTDLADLPCGRVDLDNGVFANVQRYVPPADKQYEQHFVYADVQFVIAGSEHLVEAPIDAERYREAGAAEDCALTDDADGAPTTVSLAAGDFCIVWPGEAHKPGLSDGAYEGEVRKIVVKVPVA